MSGVVVLQTLHALTEWKGKILFLFLTTQFFKLLYHYMFSYLLLFRRS